MEITTCYVLKGLSCCVLQAALLAGEINCTREDHLSSLNRCPAAAQAKCLKELADCVVGVGLGALSSHTGAGGFGNVPVRETAKSCAGAGPCCWGAGLAQIKRWAEGRSAAVPHL